ncbi:MAG: hypothetical protein ABH808_00970 [Candidatus Kuenenbacteria bacterium]
MRKKTRNQKHREYEIEVRAHISKADFQSVLDKLINLFGKPKITKMKTFLFPSSNGYSRIRIIKNKKHGIFTEKIGSYTDKAREEINKDFSFFEVDNIIKKLKHKGLTKCSYFKSIGYSFFGLNNQKLFLSQHEHLGNFLEVEILTNKQSEIKKAHFAVSKTLANLNLQELPAIECQAIMDQMYAKTLRPVLECREKISPF